MQYRPRAGRGKHLRDIRGTAATRLMTDVIDEEIADVMCRSTDEVRRCGRSTLTTTPGMWHSTVGSHAGPCTGL
jgi:hypothetical protein